jgi:RNA-directed DNA polymerase
MNKIYNIEIWNQYVEKITNDFKLKTYPHFDPYFDFLKKKEKLHQIVSDSSLESIKKHNFLPFVKIKVKTPRYRWNEDESLPNNGEYALETKIRPIAFASHFDNYIYAFYAYSLNDLYQNHIKENNFDSAVLAYRNDLNGKCNIQFAKESFDEVKKQFTNNGECSVIALDIKGYFDNIDHEILKGMWCSVIKSKKLPADQFKIYKSLTNYSYINYSSFLKHFGIKIKKLKSKKIKFQSLFDLIPDNINGRTFNEKMQILRSKNLITSNSIFDETLNQRVPKKCGIPQGSSMSAVLSNIYLTEFDKILYKKGLREGFTYRRYCDDLLIICSPDKVNELKDFIIEKIKTEYKLDIQDKKTEIIDFKKSVNDNIRAFKRLYDESTKSFLSLPNDNKNFKNLQYLGFEYNGKSIYIRPGSMSRYFRKLKGRITKSISMAYGKNSKSDIIFKQKIYSKYSHIGKRNFLSYAKNASKKYYLNSKGEKKEGMNSASIRGQISRHINILQKEVLKTSKQYSKKKGTSKTKN